MFGVTLDQLRATHSTGDLMGVTLQARGRGFCVVADYRSGARAVLGRYSDLQPRTFLDAGRALRLLRDIGLGTAKVEMTEWTPEREAV